MSRIDRTLLVDGATPILEHNSFRHIELRYNLDTMEPERYVESCHTGTVSHYNRNKGYGFVQRDRESYFFHVRGYCRLNSVFYRNEHKVLLVVGAKLDTNNLPALGRKLRFLLKETAQGTQARMWCFEEDYLATLEKIDIRGHRTYRCTLFRDVADASGVIVAKDSLIVFEGNNLEQLDKKLGLIDPDMYNSEIFFEERDTSGSWNVCDNPLENADVLCCTESPSS